jgi:hypothetical protein
VFDVPHVGDSLSVFVSNLVCSGSKHLVVDERPLPRGRKLVSILDALNSLEEHVFGLELARVHVALVVAS